MPTLPTRWFTGSGIYRKVSVVVKEPVYLEQYGVFFTTPVVSEAAATVRVESALVNETAGAVSATVRQTLLDADGQAVALLESPCALCAGERGSVTAEGMVTAPQLWSPDLPYLYTLRTELLVANEVMDSEETRVGIAPSVSMPTRGSFSTART